jgi:hypothetical protein
MTTPPTIVQTFMCDKCDTEHAQHGTGWTRDERRAHARAIIAQLGWVFIDGADLCPRCKPAPTGEDVYVDPFRSIDVTPTDLPVGLRSDAYAAAEDAARRMANPWEIADAVLASVLNACEVREEWNTEHPQYGETWLVWRDERWTRRHAERAGEPYRVVRRLVITTPSQVRP